ncbi:LuxR C-terminal-related transcriptional regulator [Cohnella cholangitidis]|uniref:LuxR family transcriptional regulator n=1 Tax=Cohnella cholangitidis TaxID=2598458 RepID=A0A7G5BXD9_9BACL|nr:LuxR C-terminal-related transcriptional regulator [Cohnella cholangitidis]QMV41623.1 LuxR family transcriptional regulator [Cohnella cholangitidis]
MSETIGHRMTKLMNDHFIGREFELRLFERFMDRTSERPERIINVYGTAGIGKTYLLDRYGQISRSFGAVTVAIDVREALGSSDAFCRLVLSAMKHAEEPTRDGDCLLSCVNAINDSSSKSSVVLLIDGYEEIGSLDHWFRQRFLPLLDTGILVVIAGRFPLEGPWRYSPAWKSLIVRLALAELTYEEIHAYLRGSGIQDEILIDTIWLKTLGHPLSLSLLMPIEALSLSPPTSEESIDERIQHWLSEAPDEELRQLLYASSVSRTFHQDLLREITEREVQATTFEKLIGLSFVVKRARGWQLTEIVWEALRRSFKTRMPETFAAYCRRAIHHYAGKIEEGLSEHRVRDWEFAQLMRFSSRPVLRAHLRHSRESSHYWEPVDARNLHEVDAYIRQRLLNAKPQKIRCSDSESNSIFRFDMTADQSLRRLKMMEVEALMGAGEDGLQLLRSRAGEVVGLFAIVPIHEKTLPFLKEAPLSRAYFQSLDAARSQALQVPESSPAGWYVYGIDVADLEDEQLRANIVHALFEKIVTGGLVVQSPPPLDYYLHACEGLGFERAEGGDHFAYGEEESASTFVIDTRRHGLMFYLGNMIPELTIGHEELLPSPVAREKLPELTPREREVADQLIKGMTNAEIASALYISEASVKKHINTMLSKYGFRNRTQLARKILGG